ncbi:hypothetical protein TUM4630_23250 [Shewanella algidipiscicola]|uniref:Lipoprotein n=2 Tax=Shewanella algidipiscicola TaxID=614070 RepID=A0ABQ4PL37_9GAMM|nr:hypothetical protein TUM4630_23250 [Shewanella algidipiscicola]
MLCACTASQRSVDDFDIKVEDKFQTQIKGDGIKLFTYKIKYAILPTIEQPHLLQARQIQRQQSRKKNTSPDLSNWTQQIELGLEKTITMTGYCRDGFIELSRIIEMGRGEIRGECNEGASTEDIDKFIQ